MDDEPLVLRLKQLEELVREFAEENANPTMI